MGALHAVTDSSDSRCASCAMHRALAENTVEDLRQKVTVKVIEFMSDIRLEYCCTLWVTAASFILAKDSMFSACQTSFGWWDMPLILAVQLLPDLIVVDPLIVVVLQRLGIDMGNYERPGSWTSFLMKAVHDVHPCIIMIQFVIDRSDELDPARVIECACSAG